MIYSCIGHLQKAFIVGFYYTKINKLGHTDKISDKAIYAPLVLTILRAILC